MLLPDACYERVRALVSSGALENVDTKLFQSVGDTVIEISCPDCHQRKGWVEYLETFFKFRHPLSLNGGAVLIPHDSPVNIQDQEGQVFLRHIGGAIDLKKTTTIILSVHAPCGLVRSSNIALFDKLTMLLKAADRVRSKYPDCTIVKVFHVNYGMVEGRAKKGTKTYVVKRERLQDFLGMESYGDS